MKLITLLCLISSIVFAQEREVLYWVAPMDANFRKDSPGKSPMGMDLVPVYADEQDTGPGIKVAPEVIQTLGVRTQEVERSHLWRAIHTIGTVVANPNKQQAVQIHTQGWVMKLLVNEVGAEVKKGDILFTLLSHDLVNAEQDYLQILSMGNKNSLMAAKNRLLNLGMSTTQIKQLNTSREVANNINVVAPQDGVLASINIAQGTFIKPGDEIIEIVDLSEVWVKATVVENKSNWLKVNQPVDVQLVSSRGAQLETTIDYIYPFINRKNRTASVRMKLDNTKGKLKPNMFANLTIYAGKKEDVLIIPTEAVIRSGQNNRVMVAIGEGRFGAKTIQLGIESGDYVEIISGLQQGDKVVVSGQFLFDSEASLKSSIMRMSKDD